MQSGHKFHAFVAARAHGVHNLGADVLKLMLTNVAPHAANAVRADITEIAPGNGYAAGGARAAQLASGQVDGVYTLKLAAVRFTAVGGTIGAFRYAVLYNDSALNDELIGWWDREASLTLALGEYFEWDAAVDGILTDR